MVKLTMSKLLVALALILTLASPVIAEEFEALVYQLDDGDSFRIEALLLNVRIKERCRMRWYNAPEMRGKERKLGKKAKEHLSGLIESKTVKVRTEKRDKYNRLICDVWLKDGTHVNKVMRTWLTDVLKFDGVGKYDWMEEKK